MLVKILIALTAIVVVLLVVVAMQPGTFRVTRSATISAPPEVVFDQVNNLRKWEDWSPWAKLDPNMKQTYEGPAAGVGSTYSWAGDSNVGEGRMTIVKSEPSKLIGIDLEFYKPFAGKNDTEFTFTPHGEQTVVTWTISGKNNFIAKGMGLVMSMDSMIGGMFEQGLASMKTISEAR